MRTSHYRHLALATLTSVAVLSPAVAVAGPDDGKVGSRGRGHPRRRDRRHRGHRPVARAHPALTAVAFDREAARAMNLPVLLLDLVLYLADTAAVVISVSTIGNILVLALLITPAATARLLTDRLPAMMALSAALGALG